MSNTAKDIIVPQEPHLFRIVFLYAGQGDSTLLVIPDGEKYQYALVDSNNDEKAGGINITKLLKDLLNEDGKKLDLYINTHPHKDHIAKVKEIYDEIGINELWHSGHKPGGDHKEAYEDLDYVIKKLGKEYVFCLKGSTEDNKLDDQLKKLGDINYNVLAPAEYISDEIEGEDPDDRYRRIHEQCGVIRFKYGSDEKRVLITGDADYVAWKDHIADYHKDRLPSIVLSAAHHGSNSFFWKDSTAEGAPYKDHIDSINPTYVVVSAPKSKESKHNHPDKKAMDIYKAEVGKDGNVFHLGENRECIFIDISEKGHINIYPDDELVDVYGNKDNDDDNGGDINNFNIIPPPVTKIDKKPMG